MSEIRDVDSVTYTKSDGQLTVFKTDGTNEKLETKGSGITMWFSDNGTTLNYATGTLSNPDLQLSVKTASIDVEFTLLVPQFDNIRFARFIGEDVIRDGYAGTEDLTSYIGTGNVVPNKTLYKTSLKTDIDPAGNILHLRKGKN